MIRALSPTALAISLLALSATAATADCRGNPAALGTARVLAVDPTKIAAVGRKQFPVTLPLASKEVVLTFDDGPYPGSTDRVLAALGHDCVRATFFMLGRNAVAHPALARRVLAEGHTIGHHTFSHPLLNHMSLARAETEIDRGIGAVDSVLYGKAGPSPHTPFFRFPGFAANQALLERLARRGIAVFGADLWAGDWNPMSPDQQRELLLQRLKATGGGIVLMHDTKSQTARMLPALLRELKRRDYRIVHVVPAGHRAAQR